MEVAKTYQINSHYKDQRTAPNWQMVQFADAVFIDKTRQSSPPMVYRLNEAKLSLQDALSMSKSQSQFFTSEHFELLGELSEIDRKNKKIVLENKNLLTYTYLVVISGSKPSQTTRDQELIAAMQALNDALKMKPKIPSSFHQNKKSPYNPIQKNEEQVIGAADESASTKHMNEVIYPCINNSNKNEFTYNLRGYKERLYEVQI